MANRWRVKLSACSEQDILDAFRGHATYVKCAFDPSDGDALVYMETDASSLGFLRLAIVSSQLCSDEDARLEALNDIDEFMGAGGTYTLVEHGTPLDGGAANKKRKHEDEGAQVPSEQERLVPASKMAVVKVVEDPIRVMTVVNQKVDEVLSELKGFKQTLGVKDGQLASLHKQLAAKNKELREAHDQLAAKDIEIRGMQGTIFNITEKKDAFEERVKKLDGWEEKFAALKEVIFL